MINCQIGRVKGRQTSMINKEGGTGVFLSHGAWFFCVLVRLKIFTSLLKQIRLYT